MSSIRQRPYTIVVPGTRRDNVAPSFSAACVSVRFPAIFAALPTYRCVPLTNNGAAGANRRFTTSIRLQNPRFAPGALSRKFDNPFSKPSPSPERLVHSKTRNPIGEP
jgi:hypothetical protein